MSERDDLKFHRRGFLQTGAIATASAMSMTMTSASQAAPEASKPAVLPRRTLGKTGVDVTILNLGTWRNPGLNRLLRFAYANGVRYYDTAKSYGSEPAIARWLQEMPEVRKEIFLVTKDTPHQASDIPGMVDERRKALGVDTLDLFFIHALGDHGVEQGLSWPKDPEFGRVAQRLKDAGKIRFFGFSSHHPQRAEFLQAAVQGGFVDAIMLQYTPWLDKDAPLNRALDACHKRGIGLISMKQVAGQSKILEEVPKRAPDLIARGLNPYQALLHAIWTDERIASSCVSMRHLDQIRENTKAAAGFTPMKQAEIEQLRDACLAAGPTFCADCDGRCARAAGTTAPLGDLTRLLTYHDQYGYRGEARRLYARLSETERNWHGADLAAASHACPNRLDFASLLPRVDRHLA